MRKKISVIGAGNVGGSLTQRLAERNYADLVLLDVVEGLPQGKALDILEAGPVVGYDCRILGTNNYADTQGSDLVVVTSGVARKPGTNRDELLFTNMEIIKSVTENVVKYSPNCVLVMVSNPLDAMAQLAHQVSRFPRNRVVGMAGVLDTSRFRTFIAQELNVSPADVTSFVLGGHGDTMVPVPRLTTVAGVPITELLPRETIDRLVQRARDGGAEIVRYLKTSSAFYAPSASIAAMVDSILCDQKKILPCSVYLEGEYGIRGLFSGVPVKLGQNGMEAVVEVKLSPEEQAALHKSAEAVRELVDLMMARQRQA